MSEHGELEPELDSLAENRMAIVLTLGMLVMSVKLLLDIPIREWKYCSLFNEAGTTLLIGMVLGLLNWSVDMFVGHPLMEIVPETYAEVFSLILLPPIIFGAGFTMKAKHFMENFGAIVVYAVVGTVVVATIIASGLWILLQADVISGLSTHDPVEAMLYGSSLAATDTVAIVAVFQELNIDPLVYSLVFGESVINDAVAIVLFRTFRQFLGKPIFEAATFLLIIGKFLYTSIGSCVIGMVVAAISAAILKKLHHYFAPAHETIWMLIFAFASYLLAELAHLSGILSVFVCSVLMSHYHWYTLSQDAQVTLLTISAAVAGMCDSLVFLSIGMFVFRVDVTYESWDPNFLTAVTILCFAARAVEVFPFTALLNLTRIGEDRILIKHQIMIWFAGMRGAVALVLALIISADLQSTGLLINATLFMVLLTNLVVGPLVKPLTRWLNIKTGKHGENLNMRTMLDDQAPDDDGSVPLEMVQLEEGLIEASPLAPIIKAQRKARGRFATFMKHLDNQYLKPVLGGKAPNIAKLNAEIAAGAFDSDSSSGGGERRQSRDGLIAKLTRAPSERNSLSLDRRSHDRASHDRPSHDRPSHDRPAAPAAPQPDSS